MNNDVQWNFPHISEEEVGEKILQGVKFRGLTLLLGNRKGTGRFSGKQLHCPKINKDRGTTAWTSWAELSRWE